MYIDCDMTYDSVQEREREKKTLGMFSSESLFISNVSIYIYQAINMEIIEVIEYLGDMIDDSFLFLFLCMNKFTVFYSYYS